MRRLSKPFTAIGLLVLAIAGCSHKAVTTPAPPSDNSYMDLMSGWRLRILVPLVKGTGSAVEASCEPRNENNQLVMICSAQNLIGYETSYYLAEPSSNGRVRLRFQSAELSVDGKPQPEKKALPLPFALPRKPEHIRLIYLIRESHQSDHDMAIAAAQNLSDLDAFTKALKAAPGMCKSDGPVFCTYVPNGISVRPESLTSSGWS